MLRGLQDGPAWLVWEVDGELEAVEVQVTRAAVSYPRTQTYYGTFESVRVPIENWRFEIKGFLMRNLHDNRKKLKP